MFSTKNQASLSAAAPLSQKVTFTYSFASAFVTSLAHYQPFASVPSALQALILLCLVRKIRLHFQPPLLFRKRSHSRRLLICKRIRNAFGSLPTFYECACGTLKPRFCCVFLFIESLEFLICTTFKRISSRVASGLSNRKSIISSVC